MIIILLLQLLIAFQGFDVCDDGFVLTFYQQIFDNPESVEYNFLYWFTGIVGGIWYKIFEDGGILWFRLLAIFVNTLTFYFTYKLLKKYINKYFLLSALTMVVFVNDYGYLTFYHNQLTALMTVLIISLIYKSIEYEKWFLYFTSGVLLSINVFTRIPNAVLFILILAVPYAYILKKQSVLKSIRPLLLISLGSLFGFVLVFIVLFVLGQLDIMKNALLTIIDLGSTENSSHNFTDIFKSQYNNYYNILKEGIKFSVIVAIILMFLKLFANNKPLKYLSTVFVFILFLLWFNTHNIYPIYFLCLFGSLSVLFIRNMIWHIKVLGFLSFFTLITVTFGTGGGILNSGYMVVWLGLPMFFLIIELLIKKPLEIRFLRFKIYTSVVKYGNGIKLFSIILISSFLLLKAYNISQESYFDRGSRFQKTYSINHKLTYGIYTTKRRAAIINELLINLDEYVQKDDFLLVYDNMPMIHFLTQTKPYMYNPWVWIYDYNSFEKKIIKAEKSIEKLPIVVQQKFETFYRFSEPIEEYMATDKKNTNYHSNERNAIMNSFLKRNHYKIVWSNAYFNIYQSEKTND